MTVRMNIDMIRPWMASNISAGNLSHLILFLVVLLMFFPQRANSQGLTETRESSENLIATLDTIWQTEQEPLRLRDDLMEQYGVDSKEAQVQQEIYEKNHIINEVKVRGILDRYGWPSRDMIGDQGNMILCNVMQHSDYVVRMQYLPMMRQAVEENKLEARYLVRAEDRIATDDGNLQIYGGQMKFYPETKSFNVWPVYDPTNIDKRRSEIGLEPIAVWLKRRFDFDWNLEEQIRRSEEFEKERQRKATDNK